jgi:predicted ATPase
MELLERTSFLQTMAEYAGEARRGDGRLVLVSGESGIGKTSLLEALQRDLEGARWLWGACDGLLTPRPLGPLFDIGSQLDGELAGLCRQGAPRDQLFGAFFAEITAPGFTVVVMEDLHWADEATTDLLSFLGRRMGATAAEGGLYFPRSASSGVNILSMGSSKNRAIRNASGSDGR